jgi:uncharacterized membrane protein
MQVTLVQARSARVAEWRVILAVVVGLCCAGTVAAFLPWEGTILVGWDGAALTYGGLLWVTILPLNPSETRSHALREDTSRALADLIVLGAAVASLAAVGLILAKAANTSGGMKALLIVIGVLSVVSAWQTVHGTFTLRYARLYYAGSPGGVNFNQEGPPDYADFAYLAFTIGMTFQVSDTALTERDVRRMALRHALLAYLFGAVIIGLIINVVASLLH